MIDLYPILKEMEKRNCIPKITAFNRIDGPGSSLDLREFQQCLWINKNIDAVEEDLSLSWSKNLPRTVGISINLGCIAEARPLKGGSIGIVSREYGTEIVMAPGEIPYQPKLWLLKALELFNLKGVKIELHNRVAGLQSSGLGGSATATTAVCLLANKLAGEPFTLEQIVTMAATIEQDMGISITGTQEQSCVAYGGVTDYIWFPWGIPGESGGYGSSIRDVLVPDTDYGKIESRMAIYHTGVPRDSTDVNKVWRRKLRTKVGLKLHKNKLTIAYDYREGLREQDWDKIKLTINAYRQLRTSLCKDYMYGPCWDIQGQCERFGAESFPLGAGGGGAVMVFCPDLEDFLKVQETLNQAYRKIDFKIKSRGHEFENFPLEVK